MTSTNFISSSNNVPSIDIKFRITNVYPLSGSVMGGTRVTLTVEGFSTNTTGTKVKVGQYDCVIETVSSTQIVCLIQDTAIIHKVDNQGVHPRELSDKMLVCYYSIHWKICPLFACFREFIESEGEEETFTFGLFNICAFAICVIITIVLSSKVSEKLQRKKK